MPIISRLLIVLGLLALLASVGCYNPGTSWRNPYAFAALKQDGSGSMGRFKLWRQRRAVGSEQRAGYLFYWLGLCCSEARRQCGSMGLSKLWRQRRAVGSEQRTGYLFYFWAFAALKQDGSVAAWGSPSYGGSGVPSGLSNVQAIYSTSGPLLP